MTLFLCGLLAGSLVGFVAGYLTHIVWGMPRVIERSYREGWLKPGPAAFDAAAKRRGRRA